MCRCPQLSLEQYFERAEIVVVGEVRTIRHRSATAALPERVEVTIQPRFHPGPFKGSLSGVTLATPANSASCGVAVEVGALYLLFATRGELADSSLAWFESCSGSRQYPGGPDVYFSPFPDQPNHRVVPRLFELMDSTLVHRPPGPIPEFHTSPTCWSAPRIYHQGTPPREFRERIRVTREPAALTERGGEWSPNNGYRVWHPSMAADQLGSAPYVLVDDESERPLRIAVDGAVAPLRAAWINEKLLFLRIIWGRVQFTDLVFDVELGRPIYEEWARYGEQAFHQYQAACLGQCPCLPVPGSADSLVAPPRHHAIPGEHAIIVSLNPQNQAYLDGDWDGRVFTEAGGRHYTVSQLKGALGREEYPVMLHAVEQVAGTWWLDVSLYQVPPCTAPEARPIHRGWVPAFSSAGRAVAGTWSGGC